MSNAVFWLLHEALCYNLPMKLIFIYGFPGVGKLTVATALAKKTDLKLFHNHMVLNLIIDIFGMNIPPIVALREKIWLDFFKQAVISDLEGIIFTFCFDRYLSKNFLEKVEDALGPDGSICYVELTCDDDVLKERIQAPSRSSLHKLQNFSILKKQIDDKSFYVPELINRDVLKINNSYLSPDEVVFQIMQKYNI